MMEYISMIVGFLLILVGLWGILTQKNIIKIIIGFSIFDTGLHIILVSIAYVRGGAAPVIDKAVKVTEAIEKVVDPVPHALVLTAIVIGLGVTALMLVYALKLHQTKKSLDIRSFNDLKW
jgi:multicomponent Na+:H+ antiporter subunit C